MINMTMRKKIGAMRYALIFLLLAALGSEHTGCCARAEEGEHSDTSWLIAAAKKGDVKTVKMMLGMGYEVDAKDNLGHTALYYAVETRQYDVVWLLLAAGAKSDDKKDEAGHTLLFYAAQQGKTEVVRLLLAQGADPNARTEYYFKLRLGYSESTPPHLLRENFKSALMYAAEGGYTQIVESLLSAGAKVNAESKYGETALMYAAARGQTDTVQALLEHGADINADADDKSHPMYTGQDYGGTALEYALRGQHADTAKALLAQYAKSHKQIGQRDAALYYAIQLSYTDLIPDLARQGLNKNQRASFLWAAAGKSSLEIFKFFLDQMPDDEFRNPQVATNILVNAAESGVLAKVKLVVERGANVNVRDGRGQNALYYAVYQSAPDVVGYLLDKGIEVNVSGSSLGWSGMGDTPLALAVQKGEVEIIRQLLAKGADINFKEKNRKSALDVATEMGRTDILLMFANVGSHAAGTHAAETLPVYLRGRTTYRSPLIADADVLFRSGEKLYAANCAECHRPDGSGNDKNMSLRQDRLRDKTKLSLIVAMLLGVKAPNYIPMEESQSSLLDTEIAAILTYVGKAWGNNLGLEFQPRDVQLSRTAAPTKTQDALVKNNKDAAAAIRELNKLGYLYSESLFVESVRQNDHKAMSLFLTAGMSPAAKNAKGETALFMAASTDNGEALKTLLDSGADLHQKNAPWGGWYSAPQAALMGCRDKSKSSVMQFMLDNGLDPNLRQNDRTLLMQAVVGGCAETAQVLIKRGADVNARIASGQSVLTLAKMYGRNVIPVLLAAGAKE